MPHACFDLRNMTRIPARLRKLADGILDDSARQSAVLKSLHHISDRLPAEDQTYFLPIFYKLLCPLPLADRPVGSLSEDEREQLTRSAVQGYLLLTSLNKLQTAGVFPRAALEDIWPRMWSSILIQAEHMDNLSTDGVCVEGVSYLHLSVILQFSIWGDILDPSPVKPTRPPLEAIVSNTPHIRQYVAHIWSRMIHHKALRVECAPVMRHLLFHFVRAKEKADFKQIMTGVGGTLIDTCYHFLKCLRTSLADIQSRGDPKWIIQSLTFVLETIAHNDDELLDLLLSQRLVKCLVSISIAIHDIPDSEVALAGPFFVQVQIAFIIGLAFRLPDARPWIREALRAGILVSVALCTDDMTEQGHPLLEPFTEILSAIIQCLTSYSVLSSLEKALAVIKNDATGLSDRLARSALGDTWSILTYLADERLAVKAKYDNKRSMRMCDSIQCDQIKEKTSLRRCARCIDMYYCSPECQRQDWVSGQHGRVCRTLAKKGGADISTREKSFIRFLLHTDYVSHKCKILALRGEYMSSSSAAEPFYTEFNYLTGPVRIQVLSTAALAERLPRDATALNYQLRRMELTDPGKISLDVAVVVQSRGDDERCHMFPMRLTSSKIHDGVLRLARDKEVATITAKEFKKSLKLLAEDGDLVEIH